MRRTTFVVGAGLGAGLMFFFDPRQGRRRRALARDKVGSRLRRAGDALDARTRDIANRARGVVAEARGRVRRLDILHTLERMAGSMASRRTIDLYRVVDVAAPVGTVFAVWRRYENFPRFMDNVREVRDIGRGRSHWTVAGPGGVPVEWDAELTQIVPNQLLAWKTVPGAAIEHAGIVRFQPNDDGTTRITVRMSYDPPAGAIGQTVAALFRADPDSELDADLARLKTFIESGRAAPRARRPAGDTH